jgi:hypothetical protein
VHDEIVRILGLDEEELAHLGSVLDQVTRATDATLVSR